MSACGILRYRCNGTSFYQMWYTSSDSDQFGSRNGIHNFLMEQTGIHIQTIRCLNQIPTLGTQTLSLVKSSLDLSKKYSGVSRVHSGHRRVWLWDLWNGHWRPGTRNRSTRQISWTSLLEIQSSTLQGLRHSVGAESLHAYQSHWIAEVSRIYRSIQKWRCILGWNNLSHLCNGRVDATLGSLMTMHQLRQVVNTTNGHRICVYRRTQWYTIYVLYRFTDWTEFDGYRSAPISSNLAVSTDEGQTWTRSDNPLPLSTSGVASNVAAQVIGERIHLWVTDVYMENQPWDTSCTNRRLKPQKKPQTSLITCSGRHQHKPWTSLRFGAFIWIYFTDEPNSLQCNRLWYYTHQKTVLPPQILLSAAFYCKTSGWYAVRVNI